METKIINETSEKMKTEALGHLEHKSDDFYEFDLLCLVNGKKQRLPYVVGRLKEVVGIFPYKNSPIFLYTKETATTIRLGANENKIPPIEFWREIFAIRECLNKAFADLNYPLLCGSYFARNVSDPSANWVVSFKEDTNTIKEDYHAYFEKAKIRYFGYF